MYILVLKHAQMRRRGHRHSRVGVELDLAAKSGCSPFAVLLKSGIKRINGGAGAVADFQNHKTSRECVASPSVPRDAKARLAGSLERKPRSPGVGANC